jgi:hypothetical protein
MRYYMMKALIEEYKKFDPNINPHKMDYRWVWEGVADLGKGGGSIK